MAKESQEDVAPTIPGRLLAVPALASDDGLIMANTELKQPLPQRTAVLSSADAEASRLENFFYGSYERRALRWLKASKNSRAGCRPAASSKNSIDHDIRRD
jgi:hypothetical protein